MMEAFVGKKVASRKREVSFLIKEFAKEINRWFNAQEMAFVGAMCATPKIIEGTTEIGINWLVEWNIPHEVKLYIELLEERIRDPEELKKIKCKLEAGRVKKEFTLTKRLTRDTRGEIIEFTPEEIERLPPVKEWKLWIE